MATVQLKPWQKVTGATAMTLALVTAMEGPEALKAFQHRDDVPTICEGRTQGVYLGMTQTHAQCVAWLTTEVQSRLNAVDRLTVVRQPDTRRVALADFAFNEGVQALADSKALMYINRGLIIEGCDALLNWEVRKNHVLPGLVARRQAELQLCLEGTGPDTP
jgi:lysozyme